MSEKIYVWDPLLRLFHWTLVLAFVTSYLTGDELQTVHVYSGYLILFLLELRIIWGFVGPRHARFSSFVRPFPAAFAYLRGLKDGNSKHYTGHNPAGGLMVIALLLSLGLTGFSGLKLYGVEGHGPLAASSQVESRETRPQMPLVENTDRRIEDGYSKDEHSEDDDDSDEYGHRAYYEAHEDEHEESAAEEFWEDIHEFFANLSVLLVIIHIAGVFVSSVYHNENLVGAMISGYKSTKKQVKN